MKTGTKEWSEESLNTCLGCSHDCAYCYAREMALRFGRIKTADEWREEHLILPKRVKCSGVVMFPTTHDITPATEGAFVAALVALIQRGAHVLVVSKPHLDIIERLVAEIEPLENVCSLVEFRFSITSLDAALSKIWEPGAPTPSERVAALKLVKSKGFVSSVSMEPCLDMTRAAQWFGELAEVADSVWIGKMNAIGKRVSAIPAIRDRVGFAEIGRVQAAQSDAAVMHLVAEIGSHPKVRWKDSIKKVIEKCPDQTLLSF